MVAKQEGIILHICPVKQLPKWYWITTRDTFKRVALLANKGVNYGYNHVALTLWSPVNWLRDIRICSYVHWTFRPLWQFTNWTFQPSDNLHCDTSAPIWYTQVTNIHPPQSWSFCHCVKTSTFFYLDCDMMSTLPLQPKMWAFGHRPLDHAWESFGLVGRGWTKCHNHYFSCSTNPWIDKVSHNQHHQPMDWLGSLS